MSSFAIDVAVRAFVLMSSAWMIALIVRRRSAALRAGVWTVAFVSLLALPAIARVTPVWKIAVLPAIDTTTAAENLRPAQLTSAVTQPERPVFEGRRSGGLGNQSPLSESSAPRVVSPITMPPTAAVVETTPAAAVAVSPIAIALGIWASVALLLFARIAVNRLAAARLIRRSASTSAGDAAWREDVESVRAELSIGRRVGMRFTDAVAVPAVIGVWRPTLLLPLDAGRWTTEARRVVTLHELAHVARWDAFDQLLTEAGCALYWIVPPVWIAARSAAALREQATDDAVIRAGVRPSAYAAELIDLAQSISGVEAAASLAMAGSRVKIQDRVAAILDPSARRGRVTITGALALVFVAALGVTTLAAISPERQLVLPPPPPPPPRAMPAPPAYPPMPAPMAPPAPPPAMAMAPLPPMPPGPAGFAMQSSPRATGSSSHSSSGPERSTLCPDGRDNFSNSSDNDGSRQTWSVKVSGKGCTVELKSEGKIEFNDDFTDVASITPSGDFRLTVIRSGRRQELDIDGRGTALTHTYRADGSARSYDAAVKSWLGDFLIELDRETAVGVDVRLPNLLKQGGVDGVLKETALMTSDYARSRYYGTLSKSVKLSSAETVRIMNQAASLGTQDYYASELLKSLGAHVGDSAAERAALMALVGNMHSDYYKYELVKRIVASTGAQRLGESDLIGLVEVVRAIGGDYYKSEALRAIVRHVNASAKVRQAVIDASAGMEKYYRDELLRFVRTI